MGGFLSFLGPAINAATTAAGDVQGAQANAKKQQIQDALNQRALQRQEQQDLIAQAIQKRKQEHDDAILALTQQKNTREANVASATMAAKGYIPLEQPGSVHYGQRQVSDNLVYDPTLDQGNRPDYSFVQGAGASGAPEIFRGNKRTGGLDPTGVAGRDPVAQATTIHRQNRQFDVDHPLPNSTTARQASAQELTLQNRFQNHPLIKAATTAGQAYQQVVTGARGNDPASDIATIYGVAKMFDPLTGVREGEYQSIANSQTIPQSIKAMAQRIQGGGRLTPEFKQQLLAQAQQQLQGWRARVAPVASMYQKTATKHGADASLVVYDPFEGLDDGTPTRTQPGASGLSGSQVKVNGKTFVIPD